MVSDQGMTLTLRTPSVEELPAVVHTLGQWQSDDAPLQLHPGDLGWYARLGVAASAAAVRTWTQDGRLVAIGLLDGADLLRMTLAPHAHRDRALAEAIVADVIDPRRGVLPAGAAMVEAPTGAVVKDVLTAAGWLDDEPWTPLRRDLSDPVPEPDLQVEVVGPEQAADWAAVLRSAFGSSTFTDERWRAMAAGVAHADARSLLGYDDHGRGVAAITVWSAGRGRPGLIEPMGVHADHRGHGYGRAITVAGAHALQQLGSSSAHVCTESARAGAVATYRSAGFDADPERTDRRRAA